MFIKSFLQINSIAIDDEFLAWNQVLNSRVWNYLKAVHSRYGFRDSGVLVHLSFWDATQMWPLFSRLFWKQEIMPYVCLVPSRNFTFCGANCRFWFYDCFRFSTGLSYIVFKNKWQCDLFLESIALLDSSEALLVKFRWFWAFFEGLFSDICIFMRERVIAISSSSRYN